MAKARQSKKKAVTAEEIERISAKNRKEWLDAIDRADTVADRLDLLCVLLASSDMLCISDEATNGLVSLLNEASDTIRELMERVEKANR